jgi:hypothetical protein
MPIGTKQMEQILLDAGYAKEITDVASTIGVEATSDQERLGFLTANKGWAAHALALRA